MSKKDHENEKNDYLLREKYDPRINDHTSKIFLGKKRQEGYSDFRGYQNEDYREKKIKLEDRHESIINNQEDNLYINSGIHSSSIIKPSDDMIMLRNYSSMLKQRTDPSSSQSQDVKSKKINYNKLLDNFDKEAKNQENNDHDSEEVTKKNISYMSRKECFYMAKRIENRKTMNEQLKDYKKKIKEIEEKDGKFLGNPSISQSKSSNLQNNADKVPLSTTSQPIDVISRIKAKIFFKLFYKMRELKVNLNILAKTLPTSVLKINYFLDCQEFADLKIWSNFELCAKLEIEQVNNMENEGEASLFLEKLSSCRVAFVDEETDLYAVTYSKNKKLIEKLNFSPSINNVSNSDISQREDLILILKMTDQTVINKIKDIMQNSGENKARTILSADDPLLYRDSKIQQNENIEKNEDKNQPNPSFEEDSIPYKELMSEVKQLRLLRDQMEENNKKKENEVKHKFKVYFEKLINNEKEANTKLTKEKEALLSDNLKLNESKSNYKTKVESLSKENTDLTNEVNFYKKKADDLFKENHTERIKFEESEKKVKYLEEKKKNYKLIISELQQKLDASNKKLEAKEKTGTWREDNYIIHEMPQAISNEEYQNINKILPSYENFICIFCLSKTRECLFMECGHLNCCWDCAKVNIKINKKKKVKKEDNNLIIYGDFNCPICKTDNKTFKKIYIS